MTAHALETPSLPCAEEDLAQAKRVSGAHLRRACDPAQLGFTTTADLQDVPEVVGHVRALEALRFGLDIRRDGYNVFALGPPGLGKHTIVRRLLEEKAGREPTPPDWCYVYNFSDPQKPRALRLPAGTGGRLAHDMARLAEELRVAVPAAFQSEDYRTRKKLLEEQLKDRHQQVLSEVEKAAQERGLVLLRTPFGLGLAPTRHGEVIEPEEFEKLPEGEHQRYRKDLDEVQQRLRAAIASFPRWEQEHREKIRALDRETAAYAVAHLIADLRARYAEVPPVLEHLKAVQEDILENADDFIPRGNGDEISQALARLAPADRHTHKYQVNVLVDHGATRGAPVVEEDHPTHPNLIGRVEHRSEMGTLVTDFLLIKPGALHRASGGYLVLDARKVLLQPYAWEVLKRALCSRRARIESLGQMLGLVSTVSLEPEPIPLDVKVVMVGERLLYYLLADLDPEFPELFKVAADFEDDVERTAAGEQRYACFVAALARREGLLPLDASAAARMVEHGARLAGDGERLSADTAALLDVMREADHRSRTAGRGAVEAADVQAAIDAQTYRADRVRERIQDAIRRRTIVVDTEGERCGQVNGLSVLQLGRFAFGRPSRITARVRLGTGKVVDIEREVALGGPIHSKGVLILAGFLGARYLPEQPLSLSASLVFEQSYSGVEGDSASAAELIALLSALAEVPVRQWLAVTGSVDQSGRIQAVGGVNEKIEGFFDVCRACGLSGRQGVLIPAANVKDLMLRQDLVEEAAAGRFYVYAVETVDEALTLLTGVPAGERDASGRFPPGTINDRVETRLAVFAQKARAFRHAGGGAPAGGPDEPEA